MSYDDLVARWAAVEVKAAEPAGVPRDEEEEARQAAWRENAIRPERNGRGD